MAEPTPDKAMTFLTRAAESRALTWIRTIYFSEVSFLFHLPLFLEISAEKDSDVHRPRPWFQFIIFCVRFILNLIGLIYALLESRHQTLWSEHLDVILVNLFSSRIQWYCFAASGVLYFLSYVHQRFHLGAVLRQNAGQDPPLRVPVLLYWVAHISLINFSLDLPARGIPVVNITHFLVVAINIVAILAILFVVFLEEPFAKTWGCYPYYDTIYDYKYGPCPAYFGTPESSACDQPGVRCGTGAAKAHGEFTHILVFAQTLLAVSFALYIISVQPKVDYIQSEIRRAGTFISELVQKKAT